MPAMFFVGNFGYVLVIIVGAALALEGHITIGIIVAFMVYVRTFSSLCLGTPGLQACNKRVRALARVLEFLASKQRCPRWIS